MIRNYILVDDDEFNNVLATLSIELVNPEACITAFEKPEAALTFIIEQYTPVSARTILLLDINMPKMNGWQFMEAFEKFPAGIKKQFSVYIVSSSVDPRDVTRAEDNENVHGFLSKPVEPDMIAKLAYGLY
jgi:CheY-like chemotaxis protein